MSDYATFLKIGHEYQPIPDAKTQTKLPPGVYTIKYDPRTEQVAFAETKITHDELVDLPGTAYDQVMADLEYFFTPGCAVRFEQVGLLHKMNILLHGIPGGGKTCIVNRVAYRMMAEKGIVLFNPPPPSLREVFRVLDKLQPETRVLVIFEELDQQVQKYNEESFLHILDGEVQKANAMFIATTNYLNKVPKRIRRPGRFAIRLEVGLPSFEARLHYCKLKLALPGVPKSLPIEVAEKTGGFNIDQLKDVIRAHYCMRKPLDAVITDLRKEFDITTSGPDQGIIQDEEFCEDSLEDFEDEDERIDGPSNTLLAKAPQEEA